MIKLLPAALLLLTSVSGFSQIWHKKTARCKVSNQIGSECTVTPENKDILLAFLVDYPRAGTCLEITVRDQPAGTSLRNFADATELRNEGNTQVSASENKITVSNLDTDVFTDSVGFLTRTDKIVNLATTHLGGATTFNAKVVGSCN